MHRHHERTVDRLREHVLADPTVIALIVIGSVARGEAGAGADVDCLVVFTDEEYRRREVAGQVLLDYAALAEPPTDGVSGQAAELAFLRDAADRAPEPQRFAFVDALVFSKHPAVEPLVRRAASYPEHERLEKMRSFVSQLPVHHAYLAFGEYARNEYVLAQCAVQIVLFGGRLVLAHNRMLYPSRKWFMRQLDRAVAKPASFLELARELLARPSIAASRAFIDAVDGFADWPRPPEGEWARFSRDTEQNWRTRSLSPGEW
jgi:predicted nucleotidyltransferase